MGRSSGLFHGASAAVLVGLDGPATVQRDTELGVAGFGPGAERLAERLEALFRGWEAAGRPGAEAVEVRWSAASRKLVPGGRSEGPQ